MKKKSSDRSQNVSRLFDLASLRGRIEPSFYRQLWQQELAVRNEYPKDQFKGRGLVFSVGGERLFVNLWVNLCLLRRVLKCTLPVEIWYFGKNELTPGMISLLKPFDVGIVNGEKFACDLPRGKWRGFALKSLAVIHSRFQEVFFLDADSYPVREPSFLFDEAAYRWTGACFWPDIWLTDPSSDLWSILNLPYMEESEWESGQMLIDKSRAWPALSLVKHLTRHFPYYYRHMYGDKMAFYAAWKKRDQPYAMPGTPARLVAATDTQLLLNQFDFQGNLLFQHRTTADWKLAGNDAKGGPKFMHQSVCEEFLEELQQKWPESDRNCSPNRAGTRERFSWSKSLQALALGVKKASPTLKGILPLREEDSWDAMALQALSSPASVTPRLMGLGVEAIWKSDEREARSICYFFAALIFIDPRLADMLPENLPVQGTILQDTWAALQFFVESVKASGLKADLLSVRGNLYVAGIPTQLTSIEKSLLKKLATFLSHSESGIWHEWQQFWQPILGSSTKRIESDVTVAKRDSTSSNLKAWQIKSSPPKVLVLTPLKDAADLATGYCERLSRLNYPAEFLSLGLLESDSKDQTYEIFDEALSLLRSRWRRVDICKYDYNYKIPEGLFRWHTQIQLKRREILARSRNELLHRSLKDEDWVLWLDADVIEYPRDILEQLLSYGKDILHPHCVLDYGGGTFDSNGWREQGRVKMENLRGKEILAPLDAVGGTMLFIRADLHRQGLIFPPLPYGRGNPRIRDSGECYDPANPGELETEGLGIMASDMGVQCWGLPELEILHRKR